MFSMLLCISMLVGSTFAWFTDTASATVNTIQAGTLDVELWKADSDEALDATALTWVKAEGAAEDEEVLWEPGCTYNLESFRIKNNGNLALKYKVIISGLVGDAKLLEAIDFTVSVDGTALVAKDGASTVSTVADLNNFEGTLEAGAVTGKITITGHMKEEAGNDYQDLSIDGIAITVVATQLNSEYDSTNNTYDEYATYPVVAVSQVTVNSATKKTTGSATIRSAETVSTTDTTPLATATVPADVLTTSGENATSIPMALSINEVATTSANFSVTVEDTHVAKTLEVTMTNLDADNTTPIKVTMYVGAGLSGFKLYHNSTEMTAVSSAAEVDTDQEYYYDSTTGIVTMATATFSPFTYVYDATIATPAELAAATDDSAKTVTISSAKLLRAFAKAVNADNDKYKGYTITLTTDIDLGGANWTPINMTGAGADHGGGVVTFDGQNHTISNFKVTAAEGEKNTGFFGVANFSTIKNLNVDKAAVTGINHVGAIVGHGMVTTIENCTVTNSTITANTWLTSENEYDDGDKAGAVIGYTDEGINTIKDCTVDGCTVKGYRDVGGLAGYVGTTGGAGQIVTDNTVKNTTVINNRANNYKNYTTDNEYDVREIVGEYSGTLDTSSNTATSVTISVENQ